MICAVCGDEDALDLQIGNEWWHFPCRIQQLEAELAEAKTELNEIGPNLRHVVRLGYATGGAADKESFSRLAINAAQQAHIEADKRREEAARQNRQGRDEARAYARLRVQEIRNLPGTVLYLGTREDAERLVGDAPEWVKA